MTDERSSWQRATESSYWAEHGENRPAPPTSQPTPPTWQPTANTPPPPAAPDFLGLDELVFEQISRTDMHVFDAGGRLAARIYRDKRWEERKWFAPMVMAVEDQAGRVPLLIRDPRSIGGATYDARVPRDGGLTVSIVRETRIFRQNLSVRVQAQGGGTTGLITDGDPGCRFIQVYPDVGQPRKRDAMGTPVASVQRESQGWLKSLGGRYSYRVRMTPSMPRELRLAMVATTFAIATFRYKQAQTST